ncbi:MAG: tetratricopeptide repeat protein [Candidatus Hermodarchaeota archaeon]
MSINPFSEIEINNLREFIEKNGWKIEGYVENYFRYSLKKEKLVLFSIKFPVTLPIRINIPFEVVNFRLSVAFQFWNLDQNIYNIILYLMKAIRNLVISLTIEHEFPLEGKKQQLSDILNLVIPDLFKNENENIWLNRLRISLMNKRDKLEGFSPSTHFNIVKSLKNVGLIPSFKIPWELKYGIPKIRTSETLLFSNNGDFEEFFILEKGYFTYFKDIEYDKFYIRTFFDSYTPWILNILFKEIPEFKLENYLENWIKFSRLIFDSVIEITKSAKLKQTEFINFRPSKELIYKTKNFIEDQNNFPLSALSYESSITKELFNIHNDLFNKPPTTFDEIDSINQYIKAEELMKNYRFEEAVNTLKEALIVFNKNQQRKIVVSILLKLRKIAKLLNQEDTALNYLQNALGVAKSGQIPVKYIIKIHYKLGISYFEKKEFQNALDHFNIIINFLKNEEISINKEKFLGLSYLYLGFIYLEQKKIVEAKACFKNTIEIGNNYVPIKLRYFLHRAIDFKKQGNLFLTQKFLKAGFDLISLNFEDEDILKLQIDIILELSEFYIHHRKDAKKAFYLLNNLENQIRLREISNMKRAIRWNLLMSDYYNIFGLDRDKSHFYLKQSQKLKTQLQTIGLSM